MDDDKDSKYIFASCLINWKIENFCFAYPLNNCSILSPDFMLQGLKSVYWRMSLDLEDGKISEEKDNENSSDKTNTEIAPEKIDIENLSVKANIEIAPEKMDIENSNAATYSKKPSENTPEDGLVSFYLEILPTSREKNIFVNWEMSLSVGLEQFGPYEREFQYGEHSKHGHIGIATTNEILKHLLPSKPDTINVRFYFIAFDIEKFSVPNEKISLGMSLLCKDLKHFKDREENYSDIQLKVKDGYIKAHKIVLLSNERFNIYIKEATNDTIEILDFDYKIIDALVNFLYSRELKYILDCLSISMMQCLDHFNCDALKSSYIPEQLPLNSKIKVDKHEFQWYVPDILDVDDFTLKSAPIKRVDSSTTWHLTISMKNDDPMKYISVFANIASGAEPRYFSLEFSLIDESGNEFFPQRIIRHNECYENLGFKKFVQRKEVRRNNKLYLDDCVRFLFRVRTSKGIQECSMGCHAMAFTLPSKSKHQRELSDKLLSFYKKEICSDITVLLKNKLVKVSKFILAARSPGFRQKIENGETIISPWVWESEAYLVPDCIQYMYTGDLNQGGTVIVNLKNIAAPEKLDIPSLYEDCSQYLRDRNACFRVKRKY